MEMNDYGEEVNSDVANDNHQEEANLNLNDDWSSNNMSDREEQLERQQLHRLRENAKDQLERMIIDIENDEEFERLSSAELCIRKERIRKHFDNFESADTLYRQLNILATGMLYSRIEERFIRVMSKIGKRMDSNDIEAHQRLSSTGLMNDSMHPVIRVEAARPPQIGKFNGNPADWPAFRDLFRAEVHNRDFEPVTKLLYLQEACIEGAALTLGPWQPTNDNYTAAWDVLMKAYDDDYYVIHNILGRMLSVERQECESHESLRTILDNFNSGTRQLGSMISLQQERDQLWIHLAKQRLPKSTLDAWEQHRNHDGGQRLPTFEEFKQFLDVKSKGRREFEDNEFIRSNGCNDRFGHGSNRLDPYDRSAHTCNDVRQSIRNTSINRPVGCWMSNCSKTHYLNQCERFRSLTLAERLMIVDKNHLCKCCFNSGHVARACPAKGCRYCPDAAIKHGYWICPRQVNTLRGEAADNAKW